MPKIKHVVVLMMENHTFDNILGLVGYEQRSRRGAVDGLTLGKHGKPTNFNRDRDGRKVFADYAESPCQRGGVPTQTWNASHEAYAGGANSGFVKASGPVAMRFFDRQRLPFTSSLAAHFPIGQRYFSSVLAQTYPNRRFLFAGTASGLTVTNLQQSWSLPAANGTIFDRLTQYGIDWNSYTPAPILTNASLGIIKSRGHTRKHRAGEVAGPVQGRLRGRHAAAVLVRGPQLPVCLGGESTGHPARRRVLGERRERLDEIAAVGQRRAVYQLRRGRRLLRPRASAEGDQARQHRADPWSRRATAGAGRL